MKELLRTNDPALLSFVEALLKEIDVNFLIADQHIAAVEGSIRAFQRRVLVVEDEFDRARAILVEAGLDAEMKRLL